MLQVRRVCRLPRLFRPLVIVPRSHREKRIAEARRSTGITMNGRFENRVRSHSPRGSETIFSLGENKFAYSFISGSNPSKRRYINLQALECYFRFILLTFELGLALNQGKNERTPVIGNRDYLDAQRNYTGRIGDNERV